MASTDSALDPEQMALARELLKTPVVRQRAWPAVCASALAASAALALAGAMIMAPPVTTQHVVQKAG
jgi:hypothetical protein